MYIWEVLFLVIIMFLWHINRTLTLLLTVGCCGCRSTRRGCRNEVVVWTASGSEGRKAVGVRRTASTQCVFMWTLLPLLCLTCNACIHIVQVHVIRAPCGAGASLFPPSPFTSSSFPLSLFPFFHWLYLFSSFIHPFPFYQNSPTPFPGRRS